MGETHTTYFQQVTFEIFTGHPSQEAKEAEEYVSM